MVQGKVEICGVNTAKLPLLKQQEKEALFVRIKDGDIEAREEFIKGNLRLVLSVIKRFSSSNENVDDLFQIGCIGLIKAIDNFDTTLQVKFSTYAVPMIMGEIRRFLRDNNSIRVSRSLRDTAYKAIYAKESLLKETAKEPTIQEISRQTGFSPEEIALAETATAATESIQRETGEEGFSLEDILTDTESEERMVEKIALRQAISALPERERTVIQLRYFHALTQQRVAKIMDVSQVQVSRIEKIAIAMLKEAMG